jgi:predicted glycosyltransferase
MIERRGRMRAAQGRRVMLYSHDTFGLGHLRRSRALAQILTAQDPDLSALIVTGSPIAGRFDFPERVDHVRLPGVVKQQDGTYRSLALGMDIEGVTRLRAALLAAAEESFRPDLLIVDKEPWGFRNEMGQTLAAAQARGARIVLGVRDVLDDAPSLREEWERKNAVEAVERFYDEIWIYGVAAIHDPLAALPLSDAARGRAVFTGYLRRDPPPPAPGAPPPPAGDYVVVTTGGGGDGAELIDWALAAYESAEAPRLNAVLVYGPFLPGDLRAQFDRRAAALGGRVETMSFDSRLETLLQGARGVVAMGGYNTFCEILSFDKPAVIAPRVSPRQEQLIRAAAAERLGLVRMLHKPRDGDGPEVMARAIAALPDQQRPSTVRIPGLLSGAETIRRRAQEAFRPRPRVVAHGL